MTGRISIPALREWAWKNGNPNHPDLIEGSRVLALVEAVEAAQYACDRWPARYANAEPQRVLKRALACFDFGENERG
jgi:hypothetical protein